MKVRFLLFFIALASSTITVGQDGSNILYIKNSRLDSSFIGDFIHIDFYNQSFHGKAIDTVIIVIDRDPIKFIEHRKDTGFNNWFGEQYLESIEKSEDFTIRVLKFRLDTINADSIFVTTYLAYYKDGTSKIEKSKQIVNAFLRSSIVEVLVSVASPKER